VVLAAVLAVKMVVAHFLAVLELLVKEMQGAIKPHLRHTQAVVVVVLALLALRGLEANRVRVV
tara:strand:- start:128 stop:316 length:189 start_codon:yes stop_codon:yes gene_type:complete